MLVNHFRHRVRLNLPFYLRQSLGNTILAIQNDPEGDRVCHEGLMVLVMNLLKSKKVERPRQRKKSLDYETEGSEPEEEFDKDTEDDVVEVDTKKRKTCEIERSSRKKRKNKEIDFEQDIDS